MLHYIIQTIAFQLLFLLVYDVLLKKETFFNWNRAYLIITPLLSLALPFIQLDSFKEVVPQAYAMQLPVIVLAETTVTESQAAQASLLPDLFWWQWLLLAGSLLSVLWFGYKLYKIYQLKRQGKIHWYQEYTEVLLTKSEVAFSFFKHIFLGDSIKEKNHQHIIEHELVHIKEKHTWDLMLFELLRIVFWFNPLIYIYQARVSELHEFIADAHTAKKSKKQSYELLLEQVFNTEHISFINHFFNHSLIKKRIVMLQKTRSRKVWQLKYLLMVPLVLGMLVYTSCEKDKSENSEVTAIDDIALKKEIEERIDSRLENGENLNDLISEYRKEYPFTKGKIQSKEEYYAGNYLKYKYINNQAVTSNSSDDILLEQMDSIYKRPYSEYVEWASSPEGKQARTRSQSSGKHTGTPFTVVSQKPTFKGHENDENLFESFKEQLDIHVRKNFRYPEEAQLNGEQGRVYVQFIVGKEGNVTVLNLRGPAKSLEAEALRIIEKLPQLNPGKDKDGNPVPVSFAYPISFSLDTPTPGENKPMNKQDGGPEVPFAVVSQKPAFPTCIDIIEKEQFQCFKDQLDAHVRKYFRYPKKAHDQGVQGRVYVQFKINPDGSTTVMRTRGPHELLEAEAKRIINALPVIEPGRDDNGNAVPVTFAYPIVFRLSDQTKFTKVSDKQTSMVKPNAGARAVYQEYDSSLESGIVKGNVSNNGKGLPGVAIVIEGTSKGAVTNYDGDFAIKVEKGQKLIFQYKGLPNTEVKIADNNVLKIIM
ncbi:TonB family protein [Zhouia amylolytica]|uniref:TonB family protein n=1 Tax=Zhouia amylolytica TaxID=376730 RepID=UPI0020CE22DC|nr:TonB family protein [Zhouia amylolytica]MCQ0110266.1 TonB family protein [Zhouia amylolytica]